MPENPSSIGIIAGNRALPLMFARQARTMGIRRIVAAAFENETDPALAELVDEVVWLKVGQLGRLIDTFTQRGISRCVMLGQIAPRNLFDLRPDLRAMAMLLKLREKNAHTLFGAVAAELARDGVELVSALPWLQPLMPGSGFQLGPALTAEQRADLAFGFRIGKEIARLEIGQLVVVKGGTVLAVEGFEGTDKCLVRGGELAGASGGAVAVKLARKNHDVRFDIPCLGLRTLETCVQARIAVLGFEAGMTLLLDQEEMGELARKHGIRIVALAEEALAPREGLP